jgi:anti-sigma B factor antagonist
VGSEPIPLSWPTEGTVTPKKKRRVPVVHDLMPFETSAVAGGHLIRVRGEIDLAVAPQLAEALVRFANGSVTVDLTDVTFLDSSGCAALVAAHKSLQRRGSHLHVRGANGTTLGVLKVMGLDQVLNFDGDLPSS